MLRIAVAGLCVALLCAWNVPARAAGADPDMPTLLEKHWEGLTTFELVRRLNEKYMPTQTVEAQQQWLRWRGAIHKIDTPKQRELLIKSGLLESTNGDTKLGVTELI